MSKYHIPTADEATPPSPAQQKFVSSTEFATLQPITDESNPASPSQPNLTVIVSPSGRKDDAVAVRVPAQPEEEHDSDVERDNSESASHANHPNDHISVAITKPSTLMRRTSTMIQAPTLMAVQDIMRHSNDSETPPGMFRPGTTYLIYWSYVIVVLSLYNAVTIPYRMSFWNFSIPIGEPDVVTLMVIDFVGDICFFFEMYRNFRTGFLDSNGVIVFDRKMIAQRYFKSWFWLDFVTCIPFDLIQLAPLKLIPTVRVFKILRLFQVLHQYNNIEEATTVSLQFRVGKLFFYTGVIAHFAACVKFHILELDPVDTEVHIPLDHLATFSRYLQSVYWTAGVITGRDDSNGPETFEDAAFTYFMMLISILWVAYLIASIETFAHDNNSPSAKFQTKVAYVSQFMHQFQLPKEIHDKVKAYYSYLWSSTLRFEAEQFLQTLPATLQADVNLSLNRVIERAEIFQGVDSGFLVLIVQSLTTIVSIPGEVICSVDLAGLEMWFISEGEVEILIGPKLATIATLRPGDYFGEYAIFTSKTRTATARSVSYCTLLVLTAQSLLQAMSLYPNSDAVIRDHVDEHRNKTLLQERNFLGLDANPGNKKGGKGGNANAKLKKLITVDEHVQNNRDNRFTISPTDRRYKAWEIIVFMFVIWNAISLPIRIGYFFDYVHPIVLVLDYLGDVILILDIPVNFRLRFVEGGAEISDVALIQSKYIRGWCVPHVLASLPIDFGMLAEMTPNPLYRLNRVIRVAHLHVRILAKLQDSTHSEVWSLLYLCSNFVFLSHWAGCVYWTFTRFEDYQPNYISGSHTGEPDYSGWLPSQALRDAPTLYQYLQGQFFSISLLAGIGRHLYPPSDAGVFLSLAHMFLGIFVVSYLIGKVGHLIYQLNASASEFKAEVTFVSQLMEYRKVSPDVAARVAQYMKHVWTSQKGIDPNVALRGLPLQIRTDIMMSVCEDMIRKVPRFKDLDDNFVRQLVSELTFVELPAGEFVFRQGEVGDCMFFISKGLVEILFDTPKDEPSPRHPNHSPSLSLGAHTANGSPTGSQNSTHHLKVIGQGSFFGEGALFSGTRAASIRARTPVRLLCLSADSFQKVMHVHPHFASRILQLNQERQEKLNQALTKPESVPIRTPQARHAKPETSHLLAVSPRGQAEGVSPRARAPSARKSVMRPNSQQTGLAMKVERLLAQEREKEESRRSGSTPHKSGGTIATASATSTPTLASSAAVATTSGAARGPAGTHPPTLTITTTHTIALHDHADAAHTHIISDIVRSGGSNGVVANLPPNSPASDVNNERNIHAGVPPGFNDSDNDASITSHPVAALSAPSTQNVLNPGRMSYNAKDHAHDPSAVSFPGFHSAANPATAGHINGGHHEPGLLAFPRDPVALSVGTQPMDGAAIAAAVLANQAEHQHNAGLGGIASKDNRKPRK